MSNLRERVIALAKPYAIYAYGASTGQSDYDKLALAVAAMVAEACARECDKHTGRPHTFASENADRYRGFRDGATVCAAAIRRRADELA